MKLMLVQPEDLAQYKADMQEAFQMGAVEGGFHITEFLNARHPDPNSPEDEYDGCFEGMFQFRKRVGNCRKSNISINWWTNWLKASPWRRF